MIDLKQKKIDFDKGIHHLVAELKGLRTGRASSALVEGIMVDAYGALTPLQHLASISIPDQKTILITPWDKGVIKDIEKALTAASLGVNPISDGAGVRLVLPNLTEENRRGLLKVMGQKVEAAKVSIRGLRDKIRDEIAKSEKANETTQDQRFRLQKELDDITREYTARIDQMGKDKEKEIMTI